MTKVTVIILLDVGLVSETMEGCRLKDANKINNKNNNSDKRINALPILN